MRDTLRSGNQFYVPVTKGSLQTPTHPSDSNLPVSSTDIQETQQDIESSVERVIKEEGRDWYKVLPYVSFTYIEISQTSTGFSPFELLYEREVRGPLVVLKEEWEEDEE